jgi:hypothetical protein
MQTTIFDAVKPIVCDRAKELILSYIKTHGQIIPICLSDKERWDNYIPYSNETIGRYCRSLCSQNILKRAKIKRNGKPFMAFYLNEKTY